jgi:hypothetical protein
MNGGGTGKMNKELTCGGGGEIIYRDLFQVLPPPRAPVIFEY